MKKSRVAFDPAAVTQTLAYIRAGGYPHVAAAAAGVPPRVFRVWLERGERDDAREPYRGFVAGIVQASAQSRLVAEHAVLQKDPKFWLKHGPGKETPESPGWSGEVKPVVRKAEERPILERPEWQVVWPAVEEVCGRFPEAAEMFRRSVGIGREGIEK